MVFLKSFLLAIFYVFFMPAATNARSIFGGTGTLDDVYDDEKEVPHGYKKVGDLPVYWKLVTTPGQETTWLLARSACQDHDRWGRTDLVVIDSQEKQDEVDKMIEQSERLVTSVWIGLKQDKRDQYKYNWIHKGFLKAEKGKLYDNGKNGSSYQNWLDDPSIGALNNYQKYDCVLVEKLLGPARWVVSHCDELESYICEFDPSYSWNMQGVPEWKPPAEETEYPESMQGVPEWKPTAEETEYPELIGKENGKSPGRFP